MNVCAICAAIIDDVEYHYHAWAFIKKITEKNPDILSMDYVCDLISSY
jgi:hypothetical protein